MIYTICEFDREGGGIFRQIEANTAKEALKDYRDYVSSQCDYSEIAIFTSAEWTNALARVRNIAYKEGEY